MGHEDDPINDQYETDLMREEIKSLQATIDARTEAFDRMELATYSSHSGHFDMTQGGGTGCLECKRIREARHEARSMWEASGDTQ